MINRANIISQIFETQKENGFWKELTPKDSKYPDYLHYVPNFKATLWTLILLADLGVDRDDPRIKKPLQGIKDQFFDPNFGIYTLKEDHFPIPCLNGNIIYLDSYFNGKPDERSQQALDFFCKFQRFDDGVYNDPKNQFCSNISCYGKHTCYWGVVKLLKGIAFIPKSSRTFKINKLRQQCIDFILLHQVCYSSHQPGKIMMDKIDLLTFPNMYRSDFLEILWLLKKENIRSDKLNGAIQLLQSKQKADGSWHLEKEVNNLVVTVGEVGKSNPFITERALEVLGVYAQNRS